VINDPGLIASRATRRYHLGGCHERVPADGQRARAQAVYVCPTCGHESPVDGDWLVAKREADGHRRLVYGCPVCGRRVTTQPRFDGEGGSWADAERSDRRRSVPAAARTLDGLWSALGCRRWVR
jgi:predicted RNA-binding Zn-ribbon protein involved in translation (DUF1610 family)